MNDELLGFIRELNKEKRLHTLDEAATKQAVILRILKASI
ncbi:MAG: hypothetical protein CH6_0415 [Candidatus Kapaibacterium sp.]|nr:MAG: hypothetical protein CH6_0415 [Candidatus Kapabacteria bacterium]